MNRRYKFSFIRSSSFFTFCFPFLLSASDKGSNVLGTFAPRRTERNQLRRSPPPPPKDSLFALYCSLSFAFCLFSYLLSRFFKRTHFCLDFLCFVFTYYFCSYSSFLKTLRPLRRLGVYIRWVLYVYFNKKLTWLLYSSADIEIYFP